MNMIVTIEKNNRLRDDQILKYLDVMKLPKPYLEPIFEKCPE